VRPAEVIPLATKKGNKDQRAEAIFHVATGGLQTKRDEWVYGMDRASVEGKVQAAVEAYSAALVANDRSKGRLKWDRELSSRLDKGEALRFNRDRVRKSLFRPFVQRYVYFDRSLNSQSFGLYRSFPRLRPNRTICFLSVSSSNKLSALATSKLFDTSLLKKGNGSTQALPRYRYGKDRARQDNITDWALEQFRRHYDSSGISKDDVFAYVYAVLHDPVYRNTYALNLRREFPRLPYYKPFARWRDWAGPCSTCISAMRPWNLGPSNESRRRSGVAGP
jgi:predicted helicase